MCIESLQEGELIRNLFDPETILFWQTSVTITENYSVAIEYSLQILDCSLKSNSLHLDQLSLPSLGNTFIISPIYFSKFTVHFKTSWSTKLVCIQFQQKREKLFELGFILYAHSMNMKRNFGKSNIPYWEEMTWLLLGIASGSLKDTSIQIKWLCRHLQHEMIGYVDGKPSEFRC